MAKFKSSSKSPASSQSFFKKAVGSIGGKTKLLGGAALIASGAYALDQKFNDGRITDAASSPEGYGKAIDYAGKGLGVAWDVAVGAKDVIADVTASQAGNPIMMALAALGTAMLAWKFSPMLANKLVPGDGMKSSLARGGISLVAVALSALVASGVVGNLKDDPDPGAKQRMTTSAVESEQLPEPPKKMDTLTFSPGGQP